MIKIFGRLAPILRKLDDTDPVIVDFEAIPAAVTPKRKYKFLDPDQVVHKSVLTGKRHLHHRGCYAEYELFCIQRVPGDFDAHLAFMLDHFPPGTPVMFQLNGDSFQEEPCFVESLVPCYWQDGLNVDCYQLKLLSTDYVTINTNDILPAGTSAAVDHNANGLIDHNGDRLVFRTGNTDESGT